MDIVVGVFDTDRFDYAQRPWKFHLVIAMGIVVCVFGAVRFDYAVNSYCLTVLLSHSLTRVNSIFTLMLTIRRLNMDTSWALTWAGHTLLIDPWLIGSEVDGFSWFNEQWHATPPLSLDELGEYQSIVISQSYSDHLHKETLDALRMVPCISTPSAVRRLKKDAPDRDIHVLPELCSGKWLAEGALQLAYLDPGRMIDPIYNGVVIRRQQEVVVYFPHGFTLTPAQLEQLKPYDTLVLMTSFSRFKLPAFLGGAVNPGMDNALKLVEALNPRRVVHTHDENKHARGLVKKIAKVDYPDPEQLKSSMADRFVYLQYDGLQI